MGPEPVLAAMYIQQCVEEYWEDNAKKNDFVPYDIHFVENYGL